VPEPIALIEDPPVVITGRVAGTQVDRGLGRVLRRPARILGARRAVRLMGMLGESLARFTGVPAVGLPKSDGITHRRRSLEILRSGQAGETLPDPLVTRILDLADRTGADGEDPPGPRVAGHGDLGLWNVLWDGESLGLVDFEGLGSAPRLSDLAQAVGHLDWLGVAAGARTGRIAACRERLLEGFGGIGGEIAEWRRLRVGFLAGKALREARRDWEPGALAPLLASLVRNVEAEA
jgi:aminoglycoside phosphotransferase (APT) family kinase protein